MVLLLAMQGQGPRLQKTKKNGGPHKSNEKLQAAKFRKSSLFHMSELGTPFTTHSILNTETETQPRPCVHAVCCIYTLIGHLSHVHLYIHIYLSSKGACLGIYK